MEKTRNELTWIQAQKAPFDAFGILYYPIYGTRAEYGNVTVDDADLTWAMTALANLDDTAYTLSLRSIDALAAHHHHVMVLANATEGGAEENASPLLAQPVTRHLLAGLVPSPIDDVLRLVPDVTATPMYPDFPLQVMQMDEATFRYHQMCHYASTYGVEFVAGLLGLNVTVGEGWLPDVTSTEKTERDEQLTRKTVLDVVLDRETMLSVVNARLAKATRMHPAEVATAMMLVESGEAPAFGKIAFHENMLEMVASAAEGSSKLLADTLGAVAQHPGDLLKAIPFVIQRNTEKGRRRHLATRQKKAFCVAFERFGARAIAENIADGNKQARIATNYLSVARFGGPNLTSAINLVETGVVRSWNSRLEEAWAKADIAGFKPVVDIYGTRPGMLLRALTRLVKSGCDIDLLCEETLRHSDAYSLPTIVRNLAVMTALDNGEHIAYTGLYSRPTDSAQQADDQQREAYKKVAPILLRILMEKLRSLDTPLKGKRIFLDKAGVSLAGSVIMPNDTGDTGTAWPPAGIAYEVPTDKVVRFFTFWDDREHRVDVDLHFYGSDKNGRSIHVGWNASYNANGMVTSGDITTSHNSVEFLDIDMPAARDAGVRYVIQHDDIYTGRPCWKDIQTCYSGATVVANRNRDAVLYDRKNILFRDDMTGEGRSMDYALIDVENGYVRILRGTKFPFIKTMFTLETYLRALFDAQGATVVDDPEEAELQVCVARSEKEGVISLFDEGFFIA